MCNYDFGRCVASYPYHNRVMQLIILSTINARKCKAHNHGSNINVEDKDEVEMMQTPTNDFGINFYQGIEKRTSFP